ncbi:MAG: MlaD family protein [Planctomycetes bacterium]|nr:MlaD family protein [Planctomycetota bacterium]
MELKSRPLERGVGIAILVSVLVLVAGVVVSTQGRNVFKRSRDAVFYMENGQGLRKGTLVTVNGLPAGAVERVEPEVREVLEDHEGVMVRREVDHVKITVRVYEPFHDYLREGSRVKVLLPFIMGSTSIDIAPGPIGAALLPNGGQLEEDLIKGLGGKVEAFIDSGNNVMADFEEISDKLKEAVANIEGITHRINYGKSTLGELLNDDKKMYNQIILLLTDADRAVNNMNDIASDLKGVTTELPGILADLKVSMSDLRETSRNTVELTRKIGAMPDDLGKTLTSLDKTLGKMDTFADELGPFGQTLAKFSREDMPALKKLISDTADAAVLLEVASRELPGVMAQTKETLKKTEAITLSLKGTWPISGNLPPEGYNPKTILVAGRAAEKEPEKPAERPAPK